MVCFCVVNVRFIGLGKGCNCTTYTNALPIFHLIDKLKLSSVLNVECVGITFGKNTWQVSLIGCCCGCAHHLGTYAELEIKIRN